MKSHASFHVLTVLPACVALAACSANDAGDAGAGSAAGASGTAAVAGSDGAGTGNLGPGGASGAGGASAAGSSSGGSGAGGAPPSAAGSGGTAGAAAGGAAGTPGGAAGTPGGAAGVGGSVEDDGANCPVAALPAAASLPALARLPDPFTKLDGTRIATRAEWRCRREEIKKQAETYIYGEKPPKPAMVSGTVTSSRVTVDVTNQGRSASFSAGVQLPTGGSPPYPAVVVLGTFGVDPSFLRGEGVAVITYDPYTVGSEATARNDKTGAFYSIYGNTSTTGLLVAWSWGVSRLVDVISQAGGGVLQADAIGVTGCSRFGKGALTAGAFDQRIALTMPIESGSGGVPIWRGIPGEMAQSPSSAYGEEYWLGDAFSSFTNRVTALPLDTHEVVAMIAPRGLFIMDNPHIANLGPRSAHVAALAGAEVYTALGAAANLSYHSNVQDGGHCNQRPEWADPLRKALRKFLTKTGNDPGVISARSNATGNLAEWRDWSTPTLN